MSTATEKEVKAKPKFTIEDIDPEIRKDAERFQKSVVFTKGSAVGTVDKDLAMTIGAERGVTKETYVSVVELDAHLERASGLGIGQAMLKHLEDNPELTHVSVAVPTVGKNKISLGMKRAAPAAVRDSEGNVTGTTTNYGVLVVDHKSYSTKKHGEMGKISSLLGDLGTAMFGDK